MTVTKTVNGANKIVWAVAFSLSSFFLVILSGVLVWLITKIWELQSTLADMSIQLATMQATIMRLLEQLQ